jgi:hypothetical protein
MGKGWLGRGGSLWFISGLGLAAGSLAQSVPDAPMVPYCDMTGGRSNCHFKTVMSGTPTSVAGNRVIVFRYAKSGGHSTSRAYLDSAVTRLSRRYGFIATITEDPGIFTSANLANTKVVIMSNGDGDALAPGANRNALENFQQINGWGVIWMHSACAFITSGWPFGRQSCVQQYFHHNPSGTARRIFLDSGTAAMPNQGIRNPQTEFLLRDLPGWGHSRAFALADEFHCFQAPARKTDGVNVLLGYDRSSGLPPGDCPNANDASETASQDHNLAWAHPMGRGITIVNSLGHDEAVFTAGSHAGDSLLWRFIRYAAKDWEANWPDGISVRTGPAPSHGITGGSLSLTFADPRRNDVTVSDISGKRVFANLYAGVRRAEIPNLKCGLYFVRIDSGKGRETKRVRIL